MQCRLILSESQWKKNVNIGVGCINCGFELEVKTTPYFNGSISLFMPNASWVAKWNGLDKMKPGIYAIGILEDGDYADDDDFVDIPQPSTSK